MPEDRPAFYALSGGGWRDYWSLLHPPYTVWHLSYVVIGASLAPQLNVRWLVETLVAFFLAMGIAAHALDELHGRPLRTRIPSGVLVGLAIVGLAGAVALGIDGAAEVSPWIWAFIAAGLVWCRRTTWSGSAARCTPTSGSRWRGAPSRRSRPASRRAAA